MSVLAAQVEATVDYCKSRLILEQNRCFDFSNTVDVARSVGRFSGFLIEGYVDKAQHFCIHYNLVRFVCKGGPR